MASTNKSSENNSKKKQSNTKNSSVRKAAGAKKTPKKRSSSAKSTRTIVSRRQGTKKIINEETPLTPKEELFVQHYIETANGEQSAIYAGYSPKTARAQGSRLLTRVNVAYQIKTRMESMSKDSIAKAEEVMEYFTKVMRGEIQDQFGLDASLAERTKAAQELAKRTIDIENKLNAKGDTVVEVNLNWERTRNTTVTVREQQVAETETSVEEDNEGEDIYDS